MSDAARLAESVPEMVWAAVLVMKSESLVPVSALISTPLTVCVGTVLSTVNVAPDVGVDVTTFPAASVPVPTVTVPVPSPVGTA
mgnify:FL=1